LSNVIKRVCLHGTPKVIQHSMSQYNTTSSTAIAADLVRVEQYDSVLSGIISQAHQQAEQIITKAALKSDDMQRKAQDDGFKQGYQVGFDEGRQATVAECKETLDGAVSKAQALLITADQEGKAYVQAAEQAILTLAFAIADKVLARELEKNQEAVLPLVRVALDKVRDQEKITIFVSSQDYDIVLQAKRELQIVVGREQGLVVSADNTLLPGSCVIDTSNGTVDARIDTQLEMLKKALQDAI